jgi:fatty-acyl-CoA synthase
LILVNINPAFQISELEYCLNKVNVKAIIAAASYRKSNYIEILNTLCPELAASTPGKLKAKRVPDLRYVIRIDDIKTPGMLNFSNFILNNSVSN